MNARHDGEGTRGKILATACRLFAEKGYRAATHAEICRAAGVNIAAINYHFRDKQTLYAEAWRQAFQRSHERYAADGGVAPSASSAQRLHGRILAIVRRIADPDCLEFEMLHKELASPTGLLNEVMRECVEPIRIAVLGLVRELMGPQASDVQVILCQQSIRAQCFDLMMPARFFSRDDSPLQLPGIQPVCLTPEQIADHITRFSLAGIQEIRRDLESGKLPS